MSGFVKSRKKKIRKFIGNRVRYGKIFLYTENVLFLLPNKTRKKNLKPNLYHKIKFSLHSPALVEHFFYP